MFGTIHNLLYTAITPVSDRSERHNLASLQGIEPRSLPRHGIRRLLNVLLTESPFYKCPTIRRQRRY